jgi:hypothetical protein
MLFPLHLAMPLFSSQASFKYIMLFLAWVRKSNSYKTKSFVAKIHGLCNHSMLITFFTLSIISSWNIFPSNLFTPCFLTRGPFSLIFCKYKVKST